jgi:hypothetical protein
MSMPLINESELEKVGLRLGHRKELLKAIAGLNGGDESAVTVSAVPAGAAHLA